METMPQYIKRLRTEHTELGTEIEKLIGRLKRLSLEIKQSHEELETAIADKKALTLANLQESLISGEEVWDYVWNNVWDAFTKFEFQAITECKPNYKELEPALRAKQLSQQLKIQVSKMSADEVCNAVWDVVWYIVWSLIEGYNRKATIEAKQVGEELQTLLNKQATLQAELHEVLISGDGFYNVLKETGNAMVEGKAS